MDGHDAAWLEPERQRLRGRWLDALGELADRCAADGELAEAVAHAERLLRADPLREENYRRLMRLHAERGDPARALGVYHECAAVWERELGVRPSAATRAAYAALLPRETRHREAAAAPAGLVGRAAERRRLVDLFRACAAGRTQFVLLTGEAGIGKTRLLEDFRAWCARQGAVVAEARCHSAEGPLVYGPVTAWLRSGALRPRLAQLDPGPAPSSPACCPSCSSRCRTPEARAALRRRTAPAAARRRRRRRLRRGRPRLLVARRPAARRPRDLQPRALPACAASRRPRLLVAATARREEIDRDHPAQELLAGLHALDRCVEIELGRLDRAETDQLARELGGAPVDSRAPLRRDRGQPALRRRGAAGGLAPAPRSAGACKPSWRRGSRSSAPRPGTLVEVAATIGREFRVDVLAAAAGDADEALLDGLDELWRRRILAASRTCDAYRFSHDKIREVAALGVSPPRRRLLHLRIAPALERAHAADPGPVSAQIAWHYAEGGSAGHAVTWYRRAAEAAQELHASGAAVDLLERAVRQAPHAAVVAKPRRRRAGVAERDARPARSIAGYVAPAIAAHQQEALRLTAALGVTEAPPLLRSLGMSALTARGLPGHAAHRRPAAGRGRAARRRRARRRGRLPPGDGGVLADRLHRRPHPPRDGRRPLPARRPPDPPRPLRPRPEGGLPQQARQHAVVPRRARRGAAGPRRRPRLGRARSRSRSASASRCSSAPCWPSTWPTNPLCASSPRGWWRSRRKRRPSSSPPTRWNGHIAVLDGRAAGLAAIDAAVSAARGQSPAPGVPAILARIRLAAAVAAGDPARAAAAADALLTMGGAAAVWAARGPPGRRGVPRTPRAEERPRNGAQAAPWDAMPTILAVGATGTVGRHLVPQLVDRGLPVRALVRNRAADLPGPRRPGGRRPRRPRLARPRPLDGVDAVYLACGNHPAQVTWETAADRRRGRRGCAAHRQALGDRRRDRVAGRVRRRARPHRGAPARQRDRPRPAPARVHDDEPPRPPPTACARPERSSCPARARRSPWSIRGTSPPSRPSP